MEAYNQNQKIKVTNFLPVDNTTGNGVVATSIVAKVYDGEGLQILTDISVTLPHNNATSLELIVPETYNILPVDKVKDIRKVKFYYTKADGTVLTSDSKYVIKADEELIVLVNSFMSFDTAELISEDLPDIDMWKSSEEADKISTLKNSYLKISSLKFKVKYRESFNTYWDKDGYDGDLSYFIDDITKISLDQFNKLPPEFIFALRAAQVLQANGIMDGSVVEERRSEGVISETIGESKMFFSSRPVLKKPLCNAAMEILSKYLYKKVQIGRV